VRLYPGEIDEPNQKILSTVSQRIGFAKSNIRCYDDEIASSC
jgi:hypothetical protein